MRATTEGAERIWPQSIGSAMVGVGVAPPFLGHEERARHGLDRPQDTAVGDAEAAQLEHDRGRMDLRVLVIVD